MRCRPQDRRQLGPGGDAELGEDPVEVGAHGAMGQVEPLADLAVGQALGRELRDVQLVRGQLVAGVRTAARIFSKSNSFRSPA